MNRRHAFFVEQAGRQRRARRENHNKSDRDKVKMANIEPIGRVLKKAKRRNRDIRPRDKEPYGPVSKDDAKN